jgi:hypothetical protein
MSTATSPPTPSRTLDFGRCFTFLPEDPRWLVKVLVGGAFTLASALIIGLFFVAGYWARLVKRVAAGEAVPLPEWDDLGGIFKDGLPLVGLYLLYMVAVGAGVAALGCGMAAVMAGIGSLGRQSESAAAALGALGGMGMMALYVLFIVLAFAISLYLPAAFTRMVLSGRFGDGLAVRENLLFIRANLGNYALSLVLYLLAGFLAQFGILLCCVGVFPAAFWSYLVLGYALGETVRLNPGSA